MVKMLRKPKRRRVRRFDPFEKKAKERGYRVIAGLDEAGRGPWAGPLVCAAVILRPGLKLPGLTDSKLLTRSSREFLFKLIIEKCEYGIGIVSSKIIDCNGLIKACETAFKKAVQNLPRLPDFLLVDGNDHFKFDYPFKSIIRGDRRSRSIAAASVIAKVHRDRLMRSLARKYPHFHFDKHKGYGTRLHARLLRLHGPTKIHRFSFRPMRATVRA